jgi:hypothetical protein
MIKPGKDREWKDKKADVPNAEKHVFPREKATSLSATVGKSAPSAEPK